MPDAKAPATSARPTGAARAASEVWPEGKRFGFTVFDDPDGQTVESGREVYALLTDLGFRTTKGVWPLRADLPRGWGGSCEEPDYLEWCQSLKALGFEMGYHNTRQTTSVREETKRGLDLFVSVFGHDPVTMSNHYNCNEDIYWGEHRLTGVNRLFYNVVTRGAHHDRYFGHAVGHPYFWGDLCRDRIRYVRNFVFAEINTLRACPLMPYHDPARPFVNFWYASSEGSDVNRFTAMLTEANQDALVQEGGACIMYTHFGHGYVVDGKLNPRFKALMTRLAGLDGWFVPVATTLDYLRERRGAHDLTHAERAGLERKWLWGKLRRGTS